MKSTSSPSPTARMREYSSISRYMYELPCQREIGVSGNSRHVRLAPVFARPHPSSLCHPLSDRVVPPLAVGRANKEGHHVVDVGVVDFDRDVAAGRQ